jgi:acid phosphatase type 7
MTPGPVVLAAGDIADRHQRAAETARFLRTIHDATILALGDNAYKCGTPDDYADHYTPTWGDASLFPRTRACPGNHDFNGPFPCRSHQGREYFRYFTGTHNEVWTAGNNTKNFYSFQIANCRWHLVSLNSEIPTNGGSAQLRWLQADLEAHRGQPTLAFFHRPRFSSGNHGSQSDLQELWQLLCAFKTEIVLNGHDHSYERFRQQDGEQRPDRSGTAAFVVGTGGREFEAPQPRQERNSEFVPKDALGVLKLTLNDQSYEFAFLSTTGQIIDQQQNVPLNDGHR